MVMRSRVFEITRVKPDKEELLSYDQLVEAGFIEVTDDGTDVVGSKSREADVLWLHGVVGGIFDITKAGCLFKLRLLKNGKTAYFQKRFKELKTLIHGISLTDFCSDPLIPINISRLVNEQYGIYAYNGGEWENLDDFIRGMQEDVDYYIGGIVSYSF